MRSEKTRRVRRRAQDEAGTADVAPPTVTEEGQATAMAEEGRATADATVNTTVAAPPSLPAVGGHNAHVRPCPGLDGVEGYLNLEDLRMDVAEYLASSRALPRTTQAPSPMTGVPAPGPVVVVGAQATTVPSGLPASGPSDPLSTQSPAGGASASASTAGDAATNTSYSLGTTESPVGVEGGNGGMSASLAGPNGTTAPADTIVPDDAARHLYDEGMSEGDDALTGSVGNDTGAIAATSQGGEGASVVPDGSEETHDGAMNLLFNTTGLIDPTLTSGTATAAFLVCPNTVFKPDKPPVAGESVLLELETPPIGRPIEIRCMDSGGGGCQFEGGDVHVMLVGRDPALIEGAAAGLDGGVSERAHPITVSNITFRGARRASVLMLDPAGAVTFEDCTWEDNGGEAALAIVRGRRGGAGVHVRPSSSVIEPNATTTTEFAMGAANYTANATDDGLVFSDGGRELDVAFDRKGGDPSMRLEEGERYRSEIDDGATSNFEDEEARRVRSLAPDSAPRSIVTIERCTFHGNSGNATIMISSNFDEVSPEEQGLGALAQNDDNDAEGGPAQPPDTSSGSPLPAYSLHLLLKDTTFSSETVDTSVIEYYDARVESSGVVFVNNTAESIISSERGSLIMASTEFVTNTVNGKAGMVVLDFESGLEQNEGTCVSMGDLPTVGASRWLNETIVEPGAEDNANISGVSDGLGKCEGIVQGSLCSALELCVPPVLAASPPTASATTDATIDGTNEPSNETTSGGEVSSGLEAELEGCFNSWEDLAIAVRSRLKDQHDFIICPGAKLLATSPVVIGYDFVTVQCGTEKAPSRDCTITGSFSHFQVTGSSKGVELARLTMSSSSGSSVMALGTNEGLLRLRECTWMLNDGASAVLIHNNESLNTASGTLDIMPMLRAEANVTAGMFVEMVDCTFSQNELEFGAVANIGGTLSIKTSNFVDNSGKGGDVIVTNKGSLSVEHSCFNASSSSAPGAIFVQRGSEVTNNKDNFGLGITAGGFSDGTCEDIFQEAEDGNCLSSETCAGGCAEFSAAKCMIGEAGEEAPSPSPADKGMIFVPSYTRTDESSPKKIVPITVAAVVCLFVLFGLLGIFLRRRKASKAETSSAASEGRGVEDLTEQKRGLMFWKKGKRNRDGGDGRQFYEESKVEEDDMGFEEDGMGFDNLGEGQNGDNNIR